MADDEGTDSTDDDGQGDSADLGDAGKRALDREREGRQAAEKAVKATQRELDRLRASTQTDAEKVVAEAEKRGETAASIRLGQRLARSEFKAAAAGSGLDVEAILEDLNLARFVGDDGEPDSKAITAAVTRFAALAGATRPASFDGGTRTTSGAPLDMNALVRKAAGRG